MTRKPRNFTPHLRAEWQRQFPGRPNCDTKEFNDDVLIAVAFVMRQIDPTGKKPIIEPAAYPEGYEHQPSAKTRGKNGSQE